MSQPLPLSGITVVSLEQAIAAPLASRHLADWGARVIKIERPGKGDFCRDYDYVMNGMSSQFVWTNRSKESLAIDIKSDDGKRVLDALLPRADVFLQNLAPGAAARLGLDAATLLKRFPRLIACDVSGYGSGGPYSQKKAYDLLVQCEAGFLSINGTEEQPAKCGIAVADIATGMYVLNGVLMALFHRERTGKGTAFEVSLFDSLTEWMSYPAYYADGAGKPPAGRPDHGAEYAGGGESGQDAECKHHFHRAEIGAMEEIPQQRPGQENHAGRAHLRLDEAFRLDLGIAGKRDGGAGPEHACHDVKPDNDDVDVLHHGSPLSPAGVQIVRYLTVRCKCIKREPVPSGKNTV